MINAAAADGKWPGEHIVSGETIFFHGKANASLIIIVGVRHIPP